MYSYKITYIYINAMFIYTALHYTNLEYTHTQYGGLPLLIDLSELLRSIITYDLQEKYQNSKIIMSQQYKKTDI